MPNLTSSSRRGFLRAAGAAALVPGASAAAAKPNVIVVLTDDQGYGDLSCHGNPVLKTPAMDRLHSQSVRFTQFHSAPMCTPTRGQLMCGQDALHNGATSVTAGRALLRRGIPTMGDAFSAAGYATGVFGKWHLGDYYPYRPMDRGFQEAKYHLGFGISSAPDFTNDYFNGRYRDNGVVKRFEGYCTDFWFGEAMKWIDRCRTRRTPFFCYLPTNTPHGPAWVDPKYSAPYAKLKGPANFFGMIANLNENLDKLEDYLAKTGLRDNTIVVFLTDNGGTGGVQVFNAGMRGRKTQFYDGGHRVPCFVRWPAGKLGAPRDINVQAQMQDIFPTLIDLCGIQRPASAEFDGASLAPLLHNQPIGDRMLVVQYGQIIKKWDSCVIWNKWRLVYGKELYDIEADPGQEKDVAAAQPGVLGKMRDHYEKWWSRVEPRLREYAPVTIGAAQENPVTLCSSDWQDVYADNPGHVINAAGGPQGGPWNVLVDRDGDYEIELRRWPMDIDLPLSAAFPGRRMTFGSLPEGQGLPIARARLAIAGQEQTKDAGPSAQGVGFRVRLKGGTRTQLHGWFQDSAGKDLCGAFYANVRRV